MKRRSGPKSRTSIYLGVTQYKRTGRWEAHIWESSESRQSKGRQLHLGSFPSAEPAALAYDRAAQKLRPWNTNLNFPNTDYTQDEFMRKHGNLDKYDFVQRLRNWAQSSELAEACDAPVPPARLPPRPNRLAPRPTTTSPTRSRLPLSKRSARKRRNSVGAGHGLGGVPDVPLRTISELPEEHHDSDKEQGGIPQHLLELHALAMKKQPDQAAANLSPKPAAKPTPEAAAKEKAPPPAQITVTAFTGSPSANYNTFANFPGNATYNGAQFPGMAAFTSGTHFTGLPLASSFNASSFNFSSAPYLGTTAFSSMQPQNGIQPCGPPTSPLPRQPQTTFEAAHQMPPPQ